VADPERSTGEKVTAGATRPMAGAGGAAGHQGIVAGGRRREQYSYFNRFGHVKAKPIRPQADGFAVADPRTAWGQATADPSV
jgi:hypothetical protein